MTSTHTMSFAEKVWFGKNDKVVTYRASNSCGVDFFCYIRCGLAGYKKMQDDFLNKISDTPQSYGEVLYKDYLPDPDEKAREFLAIWARENNAKPA